MPGYILHFFRFFASFVIKCDFTLSRYTMKRLQLFILWLHAICFSAASHDYMFKHLEVKDGLSNNQINAIFKDSEGFMWFGTASGLNRYDGYDTKIYRSHKNAPYSLPDNYIEDIQEDVSGKLWVRTASGYAIYDPKTDTFDRNIETWMWDIGIDGTPGQIYIDKNKRFWIYVQGKGIYCYEVNQQRAVLVKDQDNVISGGEITDIAECDEGTLMVFSNGTLLCVDREQLQPRWIVRDILKEWKAERTEETYTLYADRDRRIWIFSVEGMWVYHLDKKDWGLRSQRKDYYNTVRTVTQDKYGNIWVGRDQNGIEIMDRSGKTLCLKNDPNNARTLSNNTVTALYEDEAGTMWVGTYKKGISYYNESIFKFGLLDMGDINCVEDGGNDIVWLGTNDRGLIRWNAATGEQKLFSHTADARSISSDVIVCLLHDSGGRLWAGTFWGGLNCYDGKGFTHYRADKEKGNSLINDNVWALAEDKDKNIWIGTLGAGLQCLNPQTGVFTTYSTANSNIISDYISSICVSRDNTLIVGTSGGMVVMDLNTRKMTNFTGTKSGKKKFSNQNINQIYEDSRGLLWLATREGLNVYDSKRDELYEVPIKPDFSRLLILGITEDDNKSMWVSTGGELINITFSYASETGQPAFRCYAYNDKDGLQSCDFNQRSLKRLHTGEIVVGGLYGLNRFRPGNIKYNRTQPKVLFTGIQLFNEKIVVGEKYAGRVILKESLSDSGKIVLGYKQNVFTVFFASDNYILPEKTRYSYKLEGFNEDWLTNAPDMHRVTYTNLAPGTYELRVKATNSDGYAGVEEARLKIVILPPFWMTPYAYAFYVFLLIGTLFLILYMVQRRERNKFRLRQMEQDARKTEEVNQMKFRFFTNVSHELRTPLTLIISPLESMIKETADDKWRDKLEMMHRNALRLLNLVNQLLDFRKNEMAGLHLTLSEGDIVAYVRNICNSFLTFSEKRNVHLTFFSAMDSLNMSFDEDKVGKIVMNLLSNAFKFTPEKGRVDVSLELLEGTPETLEIKVSDTGVGIKDEDKEHIFERFYQAESKEKSTLSTGSGIGLSLVRDFVTLHGGAVRVFDNVGSGSVFIVDIPVKHSPVNVATPLSEEAAEEDAAALELPEEKTQVKERSEPDKKKPAVLVVDDNEDFAAFMKDSLSLYFSVRVASDGQQAWEMLSEWMPSLIISDLMMPKMDGNELCRRVKSDKRMGDIPFILLTAKQSVENKVEGLTIGADDYVTKPFNMEVLILRMRKLIDLSAKTGRRTHIDPEPSEIVITSLDEKLIENAVAYVEANIARSELSVEELSRELGMSRVHLYKKLLQITGKTPIEFIRIIRLKRAALLLRESQQNVSEIAYQLGFNNPKYFSKYFKDEFGVLPSVYQEREGK